MRCFIGIDIGTSTTKCLLIAENGEIIHCSKLVNKYYIDDQGRVEFDAVERYESICTLIKITIRSLPEQFSVVAVTIVGASGNALLLNKNKYPISNAIGWQDERAKLFCQSPLFPFTSEYVQAVCGWRMSAGFPLGVFSWLRQYMPQLYFSAEFYSTDFVYYNYRLTGNWAIDRSTATNFYLVDQVRVQYHQPFLDYLRIKNETLPKIVKSGQPIGTITRDASLETGLSEGTLVVAGSFDHPSSARGTGMINVGDLLISCGTSWVGFFPMKSRIEVLKRNMLIDPFLAPEGAWGGMFSITSLGDYLNRYINILFCNSKDRFKKFEASVAKGMETTTRPSFDIMQKRDSPEIYLKKMLNEYDISVVCLSILNSVADILYEKINSYNLSGLPILNVTIVGGFAEMSIWKTILNERLDLTVNLMKYGSYSGCFGAAILAGIGAQVFSNEYHGFKNMNLKSMIYCNV